MTRVLLIILIVIQSGYAYAKPVKPLDLPVCKAAHAETIYRDIIKIPEDLRADILEYKRLWGNFCDRKEGVSLYVVFAKAKEIEKKFKPIFSTFDFRLSDNKTNWEKLETVQSYLQKDVPLFIPAFVGSVREYEFFSPILPRFNEVSKYGNLEDRHFFEFQEAMLGVVRGYSWHEQTWDYGACIRFGEFDWVDAFKRIEQAKKIKPPEYKRIVSEIDIALKSELKGRWGFDKICTCNDKDAVSADIKSLARYFSKSNINPEVLAMLKEKLRGIETGKISVMSEAEKHCSGG